MSRLVPLAWLGGSLILIVLLLENRIAVASAGPARQLHDTTYTLILPYGYYMISLVPAVGAAAYSWLPRLSGYRYNTYLGLLNALVTTVGLSIFLKPAIALSFVTSLRYLEYQEAFAAWQRIEWYGLALTALGGLVFAYVIFDMFVRKRLFDR